MSFFKKDTPNAKCVAKNAYKPKQAGNVFAMLFGAVAMVGVVGASTMTVMRGPVKSMSEVTKRTIAENNMMVTAKLAVISVANLPTGDCDGDGTTEAPGYSGSTIASTNGGQIPSSVGVSKQDPWGQDFVYCAWDHGSDNDQTCGAGTGYLEGDAAANPSEYAVAIISAGPDGNYQTTCNDYTGPDSLITRTSGADDILFGYTFQEAAIIGGGLWIEGGGGEAEIQRDIVIRNDAGTVDLFNFDRTNTILEVGDASTGSGKFANVNTGLISGYGGTVGVDSVDIALGAGFISADGDNEGISVDAIGNVTMSGSATANALISSTTLGVTGAATVGSLNAGSGAITTTGALSTGNASVGTLGTSGAITTGGNIILGSNFLSGDGGNEGISVDTNGNVTASNDLTVSGTFTPNSLDVTNNATVGGTLDVTGPTTLAALSAGATSITGNLDLNSNKLIDLGTPTLDADAATKKYVDDNIAAGTGFSETDPQVGDVSTAGRYCISDGDSVECTVATPPGDDLGNHTATTDLDMASEQINNLAPPTLGGDAANKTYVDNAVSAASGGDAEIMDADGDTKIQVEETADDDTIRFDTAGVERMSITPNGQVRVTNNYVEDDQSRDHILISTSQTPLTAATLTASRTFDGLELVLDAVATEDTGNDIFYSARGTVSRAIWDSADTGTDGGSLTGVLGIGQHSGSGILRNSIGVRGLTTLTSLGTISIATGAQGQVNTAADGNIILANGVRAAINTAGTGTITNALGVHSTINETDGGTITAGEAYRANCDDADTCYGLRIIAGDAEVLPDQDWGIHVDGEDKNYFSGKVGIGDTIPNGTLLLDVEGQIGATEYCDENGANCVTAAALAAATGGSVDEIADADGDTKIQVEEAADDDTIRFDTAGTEKMTILPNGNIGIGDTNPVYGISHVRDGAIIFRSRGHNNSVINGAPFFISGKARGTIAAPAAVLLDDNLAGYEIEAYDGTAWTGATASVKGFAEENFAAGAHGTRLAFSTTAPGSTARTTRMVIKGNGQIGIGTPIPDSTLLLDVEGQIGATEYCDENGANCVTAAALAAATGGSIDEIADADGDTKIQVEEGANDDTIRFDTAATERMIIDENGIIDIGSGNIFFNRGGGSTAVGSDIYFGGVGLIAADQNFHINLDANNNGTNGYFSVRANAGTISASEIFRVQENGQVGIGTTSLTASALFEVNSTDKGLLPPRMSDPSITIASPATGLIAYDSTDDELQVFDGTSWIALNSTSSITALELADADGDTKIQVEEGANDDTIRFDTAGTERMSINNNGIIQVNGNRINNDGDSNEGLYFDSAGRADFLALSGGTVGISVSNGSTSVGSSAGIFFNKGSNISQSSIVSLVEPIGNNSALSFGTRLGASAAAERFRISSVGNAGFGTGATIDPSAKVQIDSTDQGLLPPRVSDPASNIASPATGLIAYDSTDDELQVFDGTSWVNLADTGGGGSSLFTDNTTHISRGSFHILDTGLAADSTTAGLDGSGVRSFYDPDFAALRGGIISGGNDAWENANIGFASFAWGSDVEASNTTSTALGKDTTASGPESLAFGNSTTASAQASTAFGISTTASGNTSTAFGSGTTASGFTSTAFGSITTASELNSTAFGSQTVASGRTSTAFGNITNASGFFSTAFGSGTTASGFNSLAFGFDARAGDGVAQNSDATADKGNYSIAIGLGDSTGAIPQVTGNESIAMFFGDQNGEDITATNVLALEGGSLLLSNDSGTACAANKAGALRLNAAGDGLEMCDGTSTWDAYPATGGSSLFTDNTTHITREGFHILDAGLAAGSTTAGLDGDGTYTFYDPDKGALRMGTISGGNDAWEDANIGTGSLAIGTNNKANGANSIAMGNTTTAQGDNSLSVGSSTTAAADHSFAQGFSASAEGTISFSSGTFSYAGGAGSFSRGIFTRATGFNSMAMGRTVMVGNNVEQTNDSNSNVGNHSLAFGLGNGSTDANVMARLSGNESAAFFLGDNSFQEITASNVVAIQGGSLLLSNDSGTACAANKKGALRLNAGEDGIEMCDGVSTWVAFTGTGDDLGDHTATTDLIMGGNKITLTNDTTLGPDILLNGGGLIAAQGTLQFTIDSDNDSIVDEFIIKKNADNSSGTKIFSVAETGLVSFAGVTGAAAPTK